MSQLPCLTIAIPYYKGRDYLLQAVLSVLQQQDSDWHLIIVDDAGPESAQTEIEALNHPQVRYYRNEQNVGMARNWSRCLDLAETELVTLLHGDDRLLPNYVGMMRRYAHRNPDAAALYCNAEIINDQNQKCFSAPDLFKYVLRPYRNRVGKLTGQAGLKALFRGNFIMCPTICYRKSMLTGNRFDPIWKMVLDHEFTTRLLLQGKHLVSIPDAGYQYRRHQVNATNIYTASLLRFEEEVRFYKLRIPQLRAVGMENAATVAEHMRIILMNLAFCVVQDAARGKLGAAWQKIKYALDSGLLG
ncbi:MAG: glycosyltransferase family 2 protein [Zavarzinella sp.]